MEILFNNETDVSIDKQTFDLMKKCMLEVLNLENFTNKVEISLTIVDNEEIKSLNNMYRNINKETDVLSFPLIDDFENLNFKDDVNLVLGDIIISIEKAKIQANDFNHSLKRELCFLTVHSMLHLLGYDHMTKEEEKIMFEKQEIVLNKLNIYR